MACFRTLKEQLNTRCPQLELREQEPMARHTSFHVGGPAALMALPATREEAVESDVKEIKADVKSLAARPGKRWEELINKLILVTATAIVTWLLSQVGIC